MSWQEYKCNQIQDCKSAVEKLHLPQVPLPSGPPLPVLLTVECNLPDLPAICTARAPSLCPLYQSTVSCCNISTAGVQWSAFTKGEININRRRPFQKQRKTQSWASSTRRSSTFHSIWFHPHSVVVLDGGTGCQPVVVVEPDPQSRPPAANSAHALFLLPAVHQFPWIFPEPWHH